MKTIKLIALLLALAVAGTASAQQKKGPGIKMGGKARFAKQCIPDLSDAQKDTIKAIHLDTKRQVLPLKNELDEQRAHMKTLSTAANVDIAQIDAQIDKMSATQAEIMKLKAREKQQVRSQLTDDQRIVFDTMKPQMKQPFKMKGGAPGPNGGRF